ncbi:uncharacterized protein LOC131947740 [Physella acuta]|uniref:uncharacterized protein LOC131947740 n=1 Tax=Physella acuta TaxID=109671 RepID=UPI0027DB19BE|nr:uncharacterized protein LOC131947740 [Physella acuta]
MWWLHIRHVPKLAEKQDIFVQGNHMWRYRELNFQTCERSPRRVSHKSSFGQCSDRQHVYNRTCISEEKNNAYRVIQYNSDGTHRFTCMKFINRSENVVQVYEGPLSDLNDKDLCDEVGFHLQEWPWTGPWIDKPTFCPVSGGFSFRTIRRLTNEDFCENEWRRSFLEIECMKGDGMDFIAPTNSNCNPFLKAGDWKRLTCWAGWESGPFIFIIASDFGSQPRYCLRFPKAQDGEFTVLVYFSVICPNDPDGKPHHGIEYYELRMYRKDPRVCKDDDLDECRKVITSTDMCIKDTVYAPHCPYTCGKCAATTTANVNGRRCWLEPAIFGEWKLYDTAVTADVMIDKEKAVFSHLGTFQCLDMDQKGQRYKMVTLFENGCSHRYTCMEFNRRNNNILQYRIGPSERTEIKMEDLCSFRDDPHPLTDMFRSYYFKNLILSKNLWPSYCGFNNLVPFNGTINERQCYGNVSDWDETTCSTVGTITFRSDSCKELLLPLEFRCLAFIHDEAVPLQQLLITSSLDGRSQYHCWIITSYMAGGHWPWRMLHQMPTPQCSLLMEVDFSSKSSAISKLYLDDRSRKKRCHLDKELKGSQSDVTKSTSTNVRYSIPNQEDTAQAETDPHLKTKEPKETQSHPPSKDSYHTDPPIWGLHNCGVRLFNAHAYDVIFFLACSASSLIFLDIVS